MRSLERTFTTVCVIVAAGTVMTGLAVESSQAEVLQIEMQGEMVYTNPCTPLVGTLNAWDMVLTLEWGGYHTSYMEFRGWDLHVTRGGVPVGPETVVPEYIIFGQAYRLTYHVDFDEPLSQGETFTFEWWVKVRFISQYDPGVNFAEKCSCGHVMKDSWADWGFKCPAEFINRYGFHGTAYIISNNDSTAATVIESVDLDLQWSNEWPHGTIVTSYNYYNPSANLAPGEELPIEFDVPDAGYVYAVGTMTSLVEVEPGVWTPVELSVFTGHQEIAEPVVSTDESTWGRIKSKYRDAPR